MNYVEREEKKRATPADEAFRLVLQEELIRRLKKNSAYSVRSLAKALSIDPGTLSQILRGARTLSKSKKMEILSQLELNSQTIERIVGQPEKETNSFTTISPDLFEVISDWYHYAILELIHLQDFRSDPRWIAKRLGMNLAEVKIAVERLERVGFLTIDKSGSWRDSSGSVTTVGNNFTTSAFKKLQVQILEKALASLREIPFDRRDNSSLTFALDGERLQEFKDEIRRFRRKMNRMAEAQTRKSEVYNLAITLYPLTERSEEK